MPKNNRTKRDVDEMNFRTDIENGEPTFEAPWQARAFAIAVALTDRDEYVWTDFQTRLVEEIEQDETLNEDDHESVYYEQWLRALERLLVEDGILSEGDLSERAMEFEQGDRDASEFVIGDHGHDHDHDHDHPH